MAVGDLLFSIQPGDTPETLARKRQLADAILGNTARAPQNVGEGLNAIGQAIMYRKLMGQVNAGEAAGNSNAAKIINGLLGPQFPPAPGAVASTSPVAGDYSSQRVSQASGDAPGPSNDYFSAIRMAESGGNDAAKAPTSSALGRYQFTGGTWADVAKAHPELGLTPDGRLDPNQQEKAIRAFTADNAKILAGAGIPATGGNLYAAHFLGAGGAKNVLSGNDSAPVSAYVDSAVVRANPFLSGMTVGQFKNWAAKKGGGTDIVDLGAGVPMATNAAPQPPIQLASNDPSAALAALAAAQPAGEAVPTTGIVANAPSIPNMDPGIEAVSPQGVKPTPDPGFAGNPMTAQALAAAQKLPQFQRVPMQPGQFPIAPGAQPTYDRLTDPQTISGAPAAPMADPRQALVQAVMGQQQAAAPSSPQSAPSAPAPQAPQPDLSKLPVEAGGNAGAIPGGGSQMPSMQQIMQAASDPFVMQKYGPIVEALLNQSLKANDPAAQLDLKYKQAQIDQIMHPRPDYGFVTLPDGTVLRTDKKAGSIAPVYQGQTKPTGDIQEYELAKTQGFQGNFQDWQMAMKKAGAPSVNVDTGTIPQGYQAVRDSDGHLLRYEPVPGGPADKSAFKAAQDQNKSISTDVILSAAKKARDLTKEPGASGMIGAAMSYIPSSDAAELYRQVDVLKSNATVENLNAMRAASPTGGALGNVTEKEGAMLAAKAGALDPKSPNFQTQLDDYERTMLRIVNGKEEGDKIFQQTREPTPSTGAPSPPAGTIRRYNPATGELE